MSHIRCRKKILQLSFFNSPLVWDILHLRGKHYWQGLQQRALNYTTYWYFLSFQRAWGGFCNLMRAREQNSMIYSKICFLRKRKDNWNMMFLLSDFLETRWLSKGHVCCDLLCFPLGGIHILTVSYDPLYTETGQVLTVYDCNGMMAILIICLH